MENHCFYCTKDERLSNLMFEIAKLKVSTFFFFKDQTYKGRCVIAYNGHAKELSDIPVNELPLFAEDLAKAVKAIETVFNPDKINYASFGDKLPHLHFHLVPKYKNGPSWGGAFAITPDPTIHLQENEYQLYIDQLTHCLEA